MLARNSKPSKVQSAGGSDIVPQLTMLMFRCLPTLDSSPPEECRCNTFTVLDNGLSIVRSDPAEPEVFKR